MLTIDALIALILALAAPLFLAHLSSLQSEFKPVTARAVRRNVHRD